MRPTRVLVYSLIVIGLIATGGGLVALYTTLNSLLANADKHTSLTLLVQEWRSDARELQRLSRALVVNGDLGQYGAYADLAAMQNGDAPRSQSAAIAPGRQYTLVELARRLGASDEELQILYTAKGHFDVLRAREAAFIETRRSEAPDEALRDTADGVSGAQLFNTGYEQAMQAGMETLQQFTTLLNQRSHAQMEHEQGLLFGLLLLLCLSVLAVVMGMSGLAYVTQTKKTGHRAEIVRFYVSIVVILLASLFVPAWLTYDTASKNFTLSMERRQTLVAQEILRELHMRFDHARQFAQILATRPPIRAFLQAYHMATDGSAADTHYTQSLMDAREVIETFTNGYADSSKVALLDAEGDVLMASWNTDLARGDSLIPREELRNLQARGELLISATYKNRPEPVVTVPVELDGSGRAMGYIAMIVDMDGQNAIWNNRLENRERMNIFLLDRYARVVTSSNPNWKPGLDVATSFAGKAALDGREGLFRYRGDDGQERLGVYLRIPRLQWLLGVSSSERIIFSEVQQLLVSSVLLNSFASFSALALITVLLLRLINYLRKGEERLSVVIQGAEIGLWDLDVSKKRFHHNEYWSILLGEEALRGEKSIEWFMNTCHPEDRAGLAELIHQLFEHQGTGSLHYECRLRHADGEYYWRYTTGRVIERDKAGRPLRLTGTLMDIHARKLAAMNEEEQRELLEAQISLRTRELEESRNAALAATRAKSDFLSTMSHEIRTPMNAIIGFTHLFEKHNLTDKQLNYLEKIKVSAGALLCVINDVLDLSKIEAGKLEVEQVPFQLHSVINAVHSIVGFAARDKGLEFEATVEKDVPDWALGDPTRLQQVLLNLLSNAVKFTPKGFVRLTARRATPEERHQNSLAPLPSEIWITFAVTDSGIGVAPEHMNKLFTPFTQADSSVSRRFGGTGLGLAICRQLTELMGGGIRARSTVGHGTTFYVTLPLEPVDPGDMARIEDLSAGASLAGSSLILVVDDNSINQEIAKALLEAEGLTVDVVDNGEEAIAQVCRQRYDLVFMDLQMPVMDGLEATRRIRALGREGGDTGHLATLPIIAMTANAMQEDKQRCMAAGMDAHIGKPIEPEVLHALLVHWLTPQDC